MSVPDTAAGGGRAEISSCDAGELAECFRDNARDLFGYACVLTRGDQAQAEDLVQGGFEAAARQWCTVRCLTENQRRSWLRTTVASLAVSGFRRDAALGVRLPRIEARYRKRAAGTQGQALSSVLQRCSARFGSGYDVEAGLDRYRTWLREQAPGDDQEPSRTVAGLYQAYYRQLVRLAALLVHDVHTAEEIVQDSFAALHVGLHRLKDHDRAVAYLRAAVVNRSRSALRHRTVVDKHAPRPGPDLPAAGPEQLTLTLLDRSAVISALRNLPLRQREVVVLRFYADLSEAQIAATMGISRGAVKSHTARAISTLRVELGRTDE